jgi:hypothetical protein
MRINRVVAPVIRILLVIAFLTPPGFAQARDQQPGPKPQSAAQRDKMESKIRKIGIRSNVTVKLYNGKTYHGFINRIDDEEFEIGEIDLKTSIVVRFDQVKKVESGYGPKGPLGNRVGKNGRRIGTIFGLAVLAIPIIAVAIALRD